MAQPLSSDAEVLGDGFRDAHTDKRGRVIRVATRDTSLERGIVGQRKALQAPEGADLPQEEVVRTIQCQCDGTKKAVLDCENRIRLSKGNNYGLGDKFNLPQLHYIKQNEYETLLATQIKCHELACDALDQADGTAPALGEVCANGLND